MKTKPICKNLNQNNKICVLMGYLEEAGRYCEVRVNRVSHNNLPKNAIKKMSLGHDIAIQVVPNHEIVVFAKNPRVLDLYVEVMGENHIRHIFEEFLIVASFPFFCR